MSFASTNESALRQRRIPTVRSVRGAEVFEGSALMRKRLSAAIGMGGNDPLISEEHAWKLDLFLSRLDSLPPPVETEWRKQPQ